MSTAIQQHLNASEIVEIREWARVLWVKAIVAGRTVCRFVSKKVQGMKMNEQNEQVCLVATEGTIIKFDSEFIAYALKKSGAKSWKKYGKERVYIDPYGYIAVVRKPRQMPKLDFSNLSGARVENILVSISKADFNKFRIGKSEEDNRDSTEKSLDAMYGRGGWDRWDREDYEG